MSYKLASAFVQIGAKSDQLTTDLNKAKGKTTSVLGGLGGLVAGLGITAALGTAAKSMISLGSEAQELQSMFDTVFGASAKSAQDFAETMARDVGRSSGDLMEQMAGFQDTFVPLGFARDQAAELSKQMTTLTQDVGSFKNEDPSVVAQNFTSALVGQGRAVLKYGVILNQTTLQAELLSMGIAGGVKAATEQQKVQARMNIIMAATADAHGDAADTADSFANRMLGLKGAIKDVAGDVGGAFLPALSAMAGGITEWVRTSQEAIKPALTWIRVISENWKLEWEILVDSAAIQLQKFIDPWRQLPEVFGSIIVNTSFRVLNPWLKMLHKMNVGIISTAIVIKDAMMAATGDAGAAGRMAARAADPLNAIAHAQRQAQEILGEAAQFAIPEVIGFKPSDELKQLQDDLADKMSRLQRDFDVRKKAEDEGTRDDKALGGKAGATLKVKKLEFPTGFLSFEDANKKLQDAMLKQEQPQQKMVGLMEANQVANQQQLALQRQIVENTRPDGQATLKVAT